MAQLYTLRHAAKNFPRTCLRGIGQVMFQDNMWTGLLFLAGIIWGAYEEGQGVVAWGLIAGTIVSTLTGYILQLPDKNGANGLWGFNGCLVGAAFPTFMGDTVWMWIALILCSAFCTFHLFLPACIASFRQYASGIHGISRTSCRRRRCA